MGRASFLAPKAGFSVLFNAYFTHYLVHAFILGVFVCYLLNRCLSNTTANLSKRNNKISQQYIVMIK